MMKSDDQLELINLTKRYGKITVVDDISLVVKSGEFLTLLGSSGSGKTTTLMMIAGFVQSDSGSILINGSNVVHLAPEKRNLGFVFQSYALFPHLSVFENVAFPLRIRRHPTEIVKRRASEILDLVGLGSFGGRRISELSGGQQQRVALARALSFSPPVLLLDEPLSALDRQLREQLQTEIKSIQRELGATVVYVTHDQEEALALSDRLAVMQHGCIAQLGTPDHIYENAESLYVAGFLGESNFLSGKLTRFDGQEAEFVSGAGLCFVGKRGSKLPLQAGDDVTAVLRPEAIKIVGEAEPSCNKVAGEVVQRDFLGATIRYGIRWSEGVLTVRVPRLGGFSHYEVGTAVHLGWNVEDMRLFVNSKMASHL